MPIAVQPDAPIGVLDSGIGGLTVARELLRLMPGENVVYFGDSANCPYGNRTKNDILGLTLSALGFLQEKNVKIAAVACNTISSLIDEYRGRFSLPIVSIIEAACAHIAEFSPAEVGVFATEFTIAQGLYDAFITRLSPGTHVYGVASRTLAGLVDSGNFDGPETVSEVGRLVDVLRKEHPEITHIVLGCTHYPVVADLFERAAPGVTFINPAREQAKAVRKLLSERGTLTRSNENQPSLNIFTSGKKEAYERTLDKLGITGAAVYERSGGNDA